MRLVIISILLLSLFTACNTSRQSAYEYSGVTALELDSTHTGISSYDILSFLSATRHLELSGVTVDFFPPATPDSTPGRIPDAHPRASPKTLRIESVKADENTVATLHEADITDERQTVNLSASSGISESRTSDVTASSPFDSVWFILMPLFIIVLIISVCLGIYFRKAHPPN